MSQRRGEIQVFSVSFLDVLSCALGGVLLLLLLNMQSSEQTITTESRLRQRAERDRNNAEDAKRKAESEREVADRRRREAEAERDEAKGELATLTGFSVPLTLVFQINWDKQADIDLWIKDPTTAQNSYVYWNNPKSKIGYLMRDEIEAKDRQWEIYFAVDEKPGVYEVYAHYFSGDSGPTTVTLQSVLYPGQQRIQRQQDVVAILPKGKGQPGQLLAKFELKQVGTGYTLTRIRN